jgi:hypothetical protein
MRKKEGSKKESGMSFVSFTIHRHSSRSLFLLLVGFCFLLIRSTWRLLLPPAHMCRASDYKLCVLLKDISNTYASILYAVRWLLLFL